MKITKDFEYLIRLLYDNFKEYFDNGDIIFCGSLIYDKLNLYNKDELKDIDISIVSGEYGDKIIEEIHQFILEQEFRKKYYVRQWDDGLRGLVVTQYGMIDIFRGISSSKGELIEIIDGVKTKIFDTEYYLKDLYKRFKYNLKERNINQMLKFKDMMFTVYHNNKDKVNDKSLKNDIEYFIEQELKIIPDIDFLVKILYKRFKKYFDNGDLIITGSYCYNKMGLYKSTPKDLDISIIEGEENDHIVLEIINYFEKEQKEISSAFIPKPWYKKPGTIYTKKGMIDIFRNYHNNKENEENIKLLPNVYTKYFGHEWILEAISKLLLYNVENLEKDKEKTIEKHKKIIKHIYFNNKIKFKDKYLEQFILNL